jgi:hypothetical protein
MAAAVSSWLGNRKGSWLGSTQPAPKVAKPDPPRAARPAASAPAEEGAYAVPFLPVRCPQCNRADRVTVYCKKADKSPPTRYHECSRCQKKFRSYEVEEGDDGRLVLRRST